MRAGRAVVDVGYRYKQLFADDVLQAVLGFAVLVSTLIEASLAYLFRPRLQAFRNPSGSNAFGTHR
mgnify:CR=1 FL=1